MGWGMGNDFKEATQAATPDLARAYALQGRLDAAEQARVDAIRANNAAGVIGLGEKGFSEYKDWKDKQDLSGNHWATKKTPSVFNKMQNDAMATRAANRGVTLDTPFLNDSITSMGFTPDYNLSGAARPNINMSAARGASLPPNVGSYDFQPDASYLDGPASQNMQAPDGFFSKTGGTTQPFIRPETGDAISKVYADYTANIPTVGEAYDGYQNWAEGVNNRANSLRNDVVGMFSGDEVPTSGLMSGRTVTSPAEIDKIGSAIDIESMNPAMKEQLMNSIGMPDVGADIGADIGADVAADVAEDATLDAASTALDGLGGTAGVSALEGILSGDDVGTIAKDVALDAGQAALLSALGFTGPLGWGVGALLSALRG
jgi:hypothetical protein